jgi:hypothetical protein
MSLGASAADVMRLVVGEGLRPVVAGLAVGTLGAWALGRAMETLLLLKSRDPQSYSVAGHCYR